MRTRSIASCFLLSCLAGASLVGLQGCGGVLYAASVNGAAARLEEAREIGAEQLAPYEYYYAKAHLEQAQFEASEGSYGDATKFADTADEYAAKAIDLAESAHKAAGRE
jgi:hypothetical protein